MHCEEVHSMCRQPAGRKLRGFDGMQLTFVVMLQQLVCETEVMHSICANMDLMLFPGLS